MPSIAAPAEFPLIADGARVPMWLAGLDRKRRFVNRAYLDFLGCDVATALEFDWRTIVHPDDADRLAEAFAAWETTLQPLSFEARFRRHDGVWRWLHAIVQPSFDRDGQHDGFIGIIFDLTESKQAEAALRAREHRLSAYINQAAAGFGEVDLAGRFTEVNDRFCEISGYAREELMTRTMQSITHPDDLPRNQALFEAAVAHGTPYQHEKRFVRPDGSVVWVNNSVSVIRDSAGGFIGVLAVSIDVSEHRRVAGELREAEERLRLATESAGIGTWDWDLVRMKGTWSPELRRILGIDHGADTPLEQRLELIHPEDREGFVRTLGGGFGDAGEIAFEYRIVPPGGEVRWIAARGVTLRDDAGKPVRMLGVVQDVTERRRASERLEQLNRTLESRVAERTAERDGMWRLSHELLLVLDPRLRIVAANPRMAALTGHPPESLIGRSLKSFIHPDDRSSAAAAIRAGRRGAIRDLEVRLVARDGAVRSLCWNAAPEKGRAYVSARDITDEKQRIGELLSAQEALRQAQKLEAIGQLTGGVAHDFNNLLSPIIGSLDLLRRRQVGGEREQKLIGAALQSADRARVLVQRLLAFARRQPLALRPVALGDLLDGLRDLLESSVGPNVDLRIVVQTDLPPVLADANQLEMAILNLAVNARDAMPEGGTLTLAAELDQPANDRLVSLSVADTGVGMDSATLARAIEPFFSTKGVGKGTGLGLSMVEGLVGQLGGELKIDSRPSAGTTVRLRLPPADTAPGEDAAKAALPPPGDLGGRLLLVEDEPLVRAATAEILRDRGFEVIEADTAAAALDLLDDGIAVDCVVTDHLMPGMSGIELCRRLGELHPSLPTLLLTGYAEFETLRPEQPFLAKPFDTDELVARIAALLRP